MEKIHSVRKKQDSYEEIINESGDRIIREPRFHASEFELCPMAQQEQKEIGDF